MAQAASDFYAKTTSLPSGDWTQWPRSQVKEGAVEYFDAKDEMPERIGKVIGDVLAALVIIGVFLLISTIV